MIKLKTNKGFTLVEMLVTMIILGVVLTATSDTFVVLLNAYKQQSKISETNITGEIGLELLRQDLSRAGFGLPWYIPTGTSYSEATGAGATYNEPTAGGTTAAPKPIISGNNTGFNGSSSGSEGSDIIVIKAVNIARSDVAQKWTYLMPPSTYKVWNKTAEDLTASEYVTVLSPGRNDSDRNTLVLNPSNAWTALFTAATISPFFPELNDTYPRQVYGISDTGIVPRMPFNRADYYILGPGTFGSIPARCAPNTGVLVKSIISHVDGSRSDAQPLLDCVADLQVVYRLDTAGTGAMTSSDDITALSAQAIRTQLKEVRVYILTHDGQLDKNYSSGTTAIYVGDPTIGLGHTFNIGTYVHYRWRLYTIAIQPKNL